MCEEVRHYNEYKYVVLNDDIDEAINKINNIIDYYSLPNIWLRNYTDFIKLK